MFNVSIIKKINFQQSYLINNVSTWNNLNLLRKIFDKQNETSEGNNGEADFYLIDDNDDEISLENRTEYCIC